MGKYIVGITGASGGIIGFRIVVELLKADHEVYLIVTSTGKKFLERELSADFSDLLQRLDAIETGMVYIEDPENFFSLIASGSFEVDGMVIAPCSMGTLGKIASGTDNDLMIRAADVCLKERRKLLLIPRETPLNAIHLENMLKLTRAGAIILPATLSFITRPETIGELINGIVGKALSMLGIDNDFYTRADNRLNKAKMTHPHK
jgi:4-hydroxy-3-polyprenylbenzoate decarboxylase